LSVDTQAEASITCEKGVTLSTTWSDPWIPLSITLYLISKRYLKTSFMRYLYLIAGLLLLMVSSCKKDKDTSNQTDCQKNNYGTLRVNFGAAGIKHHILVQVGYGYVEKYEAEGVMNDTFHLAPTIYTVYISSTNDIGAAIDSKTVAPNISQCNETVETVAF
jgi:hypothetical protein